MRRVPRKRAVSLSLSLMIWQPQDERLSIFSFFRSLDILLVYLCFDH